MSGLTEHVERYWLKWDLGKIEVEEYQVRWDDGHRSELFVLHDPENGLFADGSTLREAANDFAKEAGIVFEYMMGAKSPGEQ